jgi:hypothetical protein
MLALPARRDRRGGRCQPQALVNDASASRPLMARSCLTWRALYAAEADGPAWRMMLHNYAMCCHPRAVEHVPRLVQRSVGEVGEHHAHAHLPAVIYSPNLGVLAVAAAGVLCAFCCVVDALPEQCLRRRIGANLLVAAVFRTKWLLRGPCSATCQRRRRPGQMRHIQGGLQITTVLVGDLVLGLATPAVPEGMFGAARSARQDLRLRMPAHATGDRARARTACRRRAGWPGRRRHPPAG